LVLPWGIVRIGLRNASEGRVAEASAAAAVSDVEVWCVGDIEAFYAELHVDTFRDRKVLEEGEIDVTEVRSEQHEYRITGTIPSTLSDFKIPPPSFFTVPLKNEMPVKVDIMWHPL
jgi:hypothetical protein